MNSALLKKRAGQITWNTFYFAGIGVVAYLTTECWQDGHYIAAGLCSFIVILGLVRAIGELRRRHRLRRKYGSIHSIADVSTAESTLPIDTSS